MKQDLKHSADGFAVILPGPDRDIVYRPDSFSPGGGQGFYTRAEAVEVLRKMHRGRERAGCPYTPETEPYAERIGERFTLEDAEANYPYLYILPGDPPAPGLPPDDPRSIDTRKGLQS